MASFPWIINQEMTADDVIADSDFVTTTTSSLSTDVPTTDLPTTEEPTSDLPVTDPSTAHFLPAAESNPGKSVVEAPVKPPKLPKPINLPADHLFLHDSLRDWGEPFDSLFSFLKQLALIVDKILFPDSWDKLNEPFQSFLNLLIHVPVSIIAWLIGEKIEILGHHSLQIGNALLAFGSRSFGLTFKDYGIGFMAFGKTVKDWFVYHQIPKRLLELTRNRTNKGEPAYGLWWNELGISYVQNRVDLEHLYNSQS